MAFRSVSLDALVIDDEAAFASLPLYAALKDVLSRSEHGFLIPGRGLSTSWDRALFLNLTFWSADAGRDVLCDDHIPADVVAHAAWHHVVSREVGRAAGAGPPTAEALFFAESIASAFDLYLVGRLLREAPGTDFITTQVPIMHDVAAEAGVSERGFESLLEGVCAAPERAFEDLRALLLDVTTALWTCPGVADAAAVLDRYGEHRFGPLLHHYQLSNWILYARAYASAAPEHTCAVLRFDEALRGAPDGLAWLERHWLALAPDVRAE
jgi:hypothetical protein